MQELIGSVFIFSNDFSKKWDGNFFGVSDAVCGNRTSLLNAIPMKRHGIIQCSFLTLWIRVQYLGTLTNCIFNHGIRLIFVLKEVKQVYNG